MAESADLIVAALEAEIGAAEAACHRGDFAAGLQAYRAILESRLAATRQSFDQLLAADLVVVDRLGDLAALFGLFDASDDLFHAMAVLTRSKGNELAADYAQLKRAELSLARGAVREAFERVRELEPRIGDITAINMSAEGFALWEARTAWRGLPAADQQMLFSRIYYLLVRLLAAIGQYPHAIRAADRSTVYTGAQAVDLAQQARLPTALARASALFETGDLDAADGALRSIGTLDAAVQPGWRVAWLELRGRLDLARGEFAGAAARFDEVLQLCRGGGFRQAAVTANLNRAHLLILLNRIREALTHVEEAEGDALTLGDRAALIRAHFLRTVADARRHSLADAVSFELSLTETLRGRRRGASSEDGLPDLIEVPQSANFLTLFEDRALQVQWLLAQKRLDAAQSLLTELRSDGVFGATPSRLVRTRLDVLQGLLAYYQGNPRQAAEVLAAAAIELAAMRLRPELWQVMRVQGWCAAQLGQAAEEQIFVQRAEALMDEIARSLGGAERAIFLLNKWTAEEEYLAGEVTRLVAAKAAFRQARLLARPFAWLKMARRLNRLITRIDRHKALVAESAVGSPAPRDERGPSLLRRLLTGTRRRMTVAFLVLPDRVLVVSCGLAHLDFQVAAVTRIEVREKVRSWHERMHTSENVRDLAAIPPEEPPKATGSGAESLVDALHLPALFAGLPARIRELKVVPDDVLHGFPFVATPLGDGQLIDRFAISTQFETLPPRRPRSSTAAKALLVAVSRGCGKIAPLPHTIAELERVGGWLAERGIASRTMVDDRATKLEVMEALGEAAVFHIACHGVFVPDRPDASGMLLIPQADQVEILSLRDLSRMQLAKCNHATLSSCWSADNFILPGRWLVSLPETLYRAGARSVLACTWPVDDRVAGPFMARFYALAGTLPRSEALRRTQVECRSRTLPHCDGIDTRDPFYWAGFTLFGEADRIAF
jgi:hypothetical protein